MLIKTISNQYINNNLLARGELAPPTEPGFSQGFFFSILSQRSFGSLPLLSFGLLSWGDIISSDYRQFDFTDTI